MATYVNDLRLKEIATGDESGTWGTSTNTNLELIAEAFSFGTEAITTNADTHTTTIADGSTDPGRSMFLKYTGALDSDCTVTIGPNTVSKLWFIENATTDSGSSGPYNIIIKQGSGATVTITNGQTKAIYSDGAGSGGAMVDAFTDLSVPSMSIIQDSGFASLEMGGPSGAFIDLKSPSSDDFDGRIITTGSGMTLDVGSGSTLVLQAGGENRFEIDAGGEIAINESGLDRDFRVESSGVTDALKVDAGNDQVQIGTGADLITATAGSDNIRIGENAGDSIASGGTSNITIGKDAGTAISTGDFNIAIGQDALKTEDGHGGNIAIGYEALETQNAGTNAFSVAVGHQAGKSITTGTINTLIGGLAGDALTHGNSKVAVG